MRTSVILAAAILLLVSVAHLLRFIFQVDVTVGGVVVPQWMSLMGFAGAFGTACFLLYENRKVNPW